MPSWPQILQAAFQHLSSGSPAAAEPLLRAVLAQQPRQPQAWAALGQIAAQRRDWAAAQAAFEASLQAEPAQPRVWWACAQVREVQSDLSGASAAFAEAARREPGWARAHQEQARLLRQLGQAEAAAAALAQALQHAPQDPDSLHLQALLLQDAGQQSSAAEVYAKALALAPQRAALQHDAAVLQHRLGSHAAALTGLEQALALGLRSADAHYNRGNALAALGRSAEAAAAYRDALALAPQHRLAQADLARLLWCLGEAAPLVALAQACERWPGDAELARLHAQLLLQTGGPVALACAEAERAAALQPQRAAAHSLLAQAREAAAQPEAATAAHAQALRLAPADAGCAAAAARWALLQQQPAQAAALLQPALQAAPEDQLLLAWQGCAWRLLGDPRADRLNDIAHSVAVIDLQAPAGWEDLSAFLAALQAELEALHTDRQAPLDQTLRHGTQTRGQLFEQRSPAILALQAQLTQTLDDWLGSRPADAEQAFLRRSSAAGWRFSDSWSSRLQRQGFHVNHVHGHGWLSCCYYVQIPPAVGAAGPAGWLQLGEPELPEPLRSRLPPLRLVQPKPGRLVLFPSYLWHGTRPFDDTAPRLTVAFDLLPR